VLVLVRHALPAYGPDIPPHEWPLSEVGLGVARQLRLPDQAYLAASAELKAVQTIDHAGPVAQDARFGEVSREGEPWGGPYRMLRRSFVEGTDHPGWEPRTAVVGRFHAGVEHHLGRAAGRPLIIATHGMAMTVWLTAQVGLTDPGAFWEALTFPDVYAVDLAARSVSRVPGAVTGLG
jgi:broad specificity phosphatase PhoE